jgi:mRNA degradation ribonuclease J1/J2
VYNCLVDGGQTKYYSDVKDCLKKFGVMNGDSVQLHGIIVTHPDGHHLGGIKMLFEEYGQKNPRYL